MTNGPSNPRAVVNLALQGAAEDNISVDSSTKSSRLPKIGPGSLLDRPQKNNISVQRRNGAPYDPRAVANFFLDYAKEKKIGVNLTKLLKILYFAHGRYLALPSRGNRLLYAKFKAWKYGPVMPCVYHCFKENSESELLYRRAKRLNLTTGEEAVADYSHFLSSDKNFLQETLIDLGRHTAACLTKRSHDKNGPWYHVYHSSKFWVDGNAIPDEDIKAYFEISINKI